MTHTVGVVDLSLILDLEVWQCWPWMTSPQNNRDQVLIMVTYIQSMKLIWLGMVDFVCLQKTKQIIKITQNVYFWTNLRSGPPTNSIGTVYSSWEVYTLSLNWIRLGMHDGLGMFTRFLKILRVWPLLTLDLHQKKYGSCTHRGKHTHHVYTWSDQAFWTYHVYKQGVTHIHTHTPAHTLRDRID